MRAREVLERVVGRLVGSPEYPADSGDLATFTVLGLRLPVRASVAIAVATFVLIFDQQYNLLPRDLFPPGLDPVALRARAYERFAFFGLVPLLTVLLLRDDPRRYGLRLGDWRRGLAWAAIGCVAMTPIVVAAASLPSFRDYYAVSRTELLPLTVTNTLDLVPSEFLFRGFLMFALVRVSGPIGVFVATIPFVFVHLSKPELELLSTLFGGLAFGWLAWQTRSILYGAIVHVYILTLLISLSG